MITPIVLAIVVLAASLILDQVVPVVGLLVGAFVILAIVRGTNQHDNSLGEIGDLVLRERAPDSNWAEEFGRNHREARERQLHRWRVNAVAAWIVLSALAVMLVRRIVAYVYS